jgi:opacity protein-like surface antigen/outer membrane protease
MDWKRRLRIALTVSIRPHSLTGCLLSDRRQAMSARWGIVAAFAVALSSVGAQAQGKPDSGPLGLQWESGLRYWYSTGNHQLNLNNATGTALVSRLTWDDLTGHAAETFFRADHWSGLFLKGTLGAGSLTDGKLKDEDFPPFVVPYSSTNSGQKHGNMNYWNVDVGYTVWKSPQHRLGGFVGYGRWGEEMHAFGCSQTAGSGICVPTIPSSVLAISEDYEWRYWRLGIVGDFKLTNRLTLTAEAAWLARADLKGGDNHHLRPDLPNTTPIDGDSNGVQLEVVVAYAFNEAFSLGLGARYWHIEPGKGHAHFEANGGVPQVTTVESERYGVFLQGSYKLGAQPDMGSVKDGYGGPAPYRWNGAYAGIHLGYGTDSDTVRLSGEDPVALAAIAGGLIPTSIKADAEGFLGGVQLGYNWRIGSGLVGIETDISGADIAGANSITDSVAGFVNTTVERRVEWLGTLRARAGFLATPNLLLYATGGLAYGGTQLSGAVNNLAVGCADICSKATSSGTHVGWTIGGGYEYAFTSNMTWKTEYQYVDLGSQSVVVFDSPPAISTFAYRARSDFDLHTLRTGINFKF